MKIRPEIFEIFAKGCDFNVPNANGEFSICYGNDPHTRCCDSRCPMGVTLEETPPTPTPTPEEFADMLLEIYKKYPYDAEVRHIEYDELIVSLLISLGYNEAAFIFEKTPMWYA